MTSTAQNRSTSIALVEGHHRGGPVIWLKFYGRYDWLARIKTLKDIRFSRNQGFWYLPNTEKAKSDFLSLQIPYLSGTHEGVQKGTPINESVLNHDETGISRLTARDAVFPPTDKKDADIHDAAQPVVSWTGKGFVLEMTYSIPNVKAAKSLEGAWWNAKAKKWMCKGTIRNLEKIQKFWSLWTEKEYQKWFDLISQATNPCKISLYYTPQYRDSVCIEIVGYGANHEIVKRVSGRTYHKEGKFYTIPYRKESVDYLVKSYEDIGYTIINRLAAFVKPEFEEKTIAQKLEYHLAKFPKSQYSTLKRYLDAMMRLNYGYKTMRSYSSKIGDLLKFTGKHDMDMVSAHEVNAYLSMLAQKNVSYSLLNTVYSAVKVYHDKVAFTNGFEMDKLKRPRKPSKLPVFLSEGELLRLFEAIDNIKHLAIVYLLYGSGLRRAELLQLKIDDVFWSRNQVRINSGKGRKDRMVNLSQVNKEVLKNYFNSYKPAIYLFEGTKAGKPYSASSVAAIIKKATKAAGITKKVTPHVLRHSFATHLMDNGIAIPKIQKLLGHKDIKTTLIYTHLTTKSVAEVVSPLDMAMKKHNRDNE